MNSSNFKLPDSYYDPPTFWFWVCTKCDWVDNESTTHKSDLEPCIGCPLCGADVDFENG